MNKIYRILGQKGRVTIPFEIRQVIGFKHNDVLSFKVSDNGTSVIVKKERICDNCNMEEPQENDEVTLLDFLNNLSPEQQKAALVHLSVKWAEKQTKKAG